MVEKNTPALDRIPIIPDAEMSGETARTAFFVTGGTVPPNAPSYVERQADKDLLSHLLAGEYCFVLNTRQMGKSSLSARTITRLSERGVRTVFLDLTKVGGQNATPDQWYIGLLSEAGRSLGLRKEFLAFWKEHQAFSPMDRFFGALRQIALPQIEQPIVIFVDEIDAVRSLPFPTDEFFAAVRACANERIETEAMKRLTFCLLGVATPADLISDTRMSPFNIGQRIKLTDFTPAEAAPLAQGMAGGKAVLERVLYWTGGHPYLTQRLCRAISEQASTGTPSDVDRLCDALFLSRSARDSDDNLAFVRNRLIRSEADIASLLDLYRQVRSGKKVKDDETNDLCAILKLSGVAKAEGDYLAVRNRIYDRVFDREWIEHHMPDAELRRQKEAYRRGLLRATGISGAVAAAFAVLSFVAIANANQAAANEKTAKAAKTEADENARQLASALTAVQEKQGALTVALKNATLQKQRADKQAQQAKAATITAKKQERFARTQQTLAQDQQRIAENQRLVAEGATKEAEHQKRLAFSEAERTRQTLYAAQISQAQYANTEGAALRARDLLLGMRPAPGQKDLRGFEWRYLWRESADASLHTFRLPESKDTVTGVAFSPNSRLLAVAGGENINIEDIVTRRRVSALTGMGSQANTLAFSPGGRLLATGQEDGLHLVDVVSGKRLATLFEGRQSVRGVGYSPDGKLIASSDVGGTVRIRDMRNLRVLDRISGALARSIEFSPDSRTLAIGRYDGTVQLWDAPTRQVGETFRAHPASQTLAVSYSPTGLLATGGKDGTIKLWNLSAPVAPGGVRLPEATLRGHSGVVPALDFSPDGSLLASGGYDSSVRLWEVATRSLQRTLLGHPNGIEVVTFSPDGKLLASAGKDGVYKLWSATNRHSEETLSLPATGLPTISPDQRLLTTVETNGIRVQNLVTGKGTRVRSPGKFILPMYEQNAPDGGRDLYGHELKWSLDWRRIQDGKVVRTLQIPTESWYDFTIPPGGHSLAFWNLDGSVTVRDARTGRVTGKVTDVPLVGTLQYLRVSRTGGTVLVVSQDNRVGREVTVCNTATGSARVVLTTQEEIRWAGMSADGSQCAALTFPSRTVTVWEAASGKVVRSGRLPSTTDMNPSAPSPDLTRFVYLNEDGTVSLRDLVRGEEIASYKPTARPTSLRLSSDGQTTYATFNGTADNPKSQLRRWKAGDAVDTLLYERAAPLLLVSEEVDNTLLLGEFKANSARSPYYRFDLPTGQAKKIGETSFGNHSLTIDRLATETLTYSYKFSILHWDLTTGRETRVPAASPLTPMRVSLNGKVGLTVDDDRGRVRLFELPSGRLIREIKRQGAISNWWLSPDGNIVGVRDSSNALITFWNLSAGKMLFSRNGYQSVTFSPDSRLIALQPSSEPGLNPNEVYLFDTSSGQSRGTLKGHTERVISVAFSAEGRRIATGGADRTTRLFDVSTRKQVAVLEGHSGYVTSVAFAPDGKTLATLSDDLTCRLWNLTTNQEVVRMSVGETTGSLRGFSADGQALVWSNGRRIRIWRGPLSTTREAATAVLLRSSTSTAADNEEQEVTARLLREISAHRVPGKAGSQDRANLIYYAGKSPALDLFTMTTSRARGTLEGIGTETLHVKVQVPDLDHSVQLIQRQVPVRPNRRYTYQVLARADSSRTMRLCLTTGKAGYLPIGLNEVVSLTREWTPIRLSFLTTNDADPRTATMTLNVGKYAGSVWVKDPLLVEIPEKGIAIPRTLLAWNSPSPPVTDTIPEIKNEVPISDVAAENPFRGLVLGPFQIEEQRGARADYAYESKTLRVTMLKVTATSWHVQAFLLNDLLKEGRPYIVTFRARADRVRSLTIGGSISVQDWHNVGLISEVKLSREWKTYQLRFTATGLLPGNPINRVPSFHFAGEPGTVWITDVTVKPDNRREAAAR